MSDLDPDADRVQVTRTTDRSGATTEVRTVTSGRNSTVLWMAGIALGIAIAIVAVMFVNSNNTAALQQTNASQEASAQAASEQAVAQQNAQTAQQNAQAATQSANQSATQAQQSLADRSAQDRAAAEDAASRASASADRAGREGSTTPPPAADNAAGAP